MPSADAYREAYALLDEEIVESLGSGGVFASTAFLQDRLDAFSDAWGGAAVRIVRLGQLTVGVFQLGERATANSVRVYGRLRDEAALLTTLAREGRPSALSAVAGAGRRGAVPRRVGRRRVDARQPAAAPRRRAPAGRGRPRRVVDRRRLSRRLLVARSYTVRGAGAAHALRAALSGMGAGLRGADGARGSSIGSTPATGAYARVSQRQYEAWHRELRASASRLFAALAGGDRRTVAGARARSARARAAAGAARRRARVRRDERRQGRERPVAASDGQGSPWTLTFQRDGRRAGASRPRRR